MECPKMPLRAVKPDSLLRRVLLREVPVRDALDRWPGKFLWLNFPSSVHLATTDRIEAVTRDLIDEAAPGDRFIIGITEDIPAHRWQGNMQAIARAIGTHGRLDPDRGGRRP